MSDLEDVSLRKLVTLMGEARARVLVAETMQRLGLETLEAPDDRLRFGDALVSRGGVLGAVGRSIKIQAILLGASTPTSSSEDS